MSEPYKVMVVGLGKRGTHHVTHFQQNDRFQVTALCDIDQEKIDALAGDLDSPVTGTDAADVARQAKPDVFCFCTLPNIRTPMIEVGIDCGAQLIAFEKPVALTTEEGMAINDMLAKSGTKAVLSYQHRYGEHYQKVKQIVGSGELGEIHTVYATALGWPAHMMTHMLHYTRWFANDPEPEWVIANAAGKKKLESPDHHLSPDYMAGFVQYQGGIRGVYEVGGGAPDVPSVKKWFHKNCIGARGTEGMAEVYTGGGWKAVTRNGVASGEGAMNYDLDMPGYIRDMADWLDNGVEHPCSFRNAYTNFQIWHAMSRSVVRRGQVALPLESPMNEVQAMKDILPDDPVMLTLDESRDEYR